LQINFFFQKLVSLFGILGTSLDDKGVQKSVFGLES